MNIQQANDIALSEILKIIGCEPTKQQGAEIWYLSPFRNEKTASFKINSIKNVWFDFGMADGKGAGGDVVYFVRTYLKSTNEDYTTADALRWLRNMLGSPAPYMMQRPKGNPDADLPALALRQLRRIKHKGLIKYLKDRGIPLEIANKYLKEAVIFNIKKGTTIYALCLSNEAEGFEIRTNILQGCIGAKGISFIRGTKVPAEEMHIFEGFMDFLSAVVREGKHFEGDVIILNSIYCLPQALAYIRTNPYASLNGWLDNDAGGDSATETLKEFASSEGYAFIEMNHLYRPYKDVNEWHVHLLKQTTPAVPSP